MTLDNIAISAQTRRADPPAKLLDILHGSWSIQILKTAIELDLFSTINSESLTAGEIALKLNCPERGVALLLDALVGLELLVRIQGKFCLTNAATLYLVRSSPLYMGNYIELTDEINKRWQTLTDAVKAGKSAFGDNEERLGFFPRLSASLFPINYLTACMVATALRIDLLPPGSTVLDVGAGSGVWSIALARANDDLRIDALDYASVLKVTTEFTSEFGVVVQFSEIPGDWRDAKISHESYDIVVLGHILHSEGSEEAFKLIEWCQRALKPEGKLLIAEFLLDEERTGPLPSLLLAVNLFVSTAFGSVFTESELTRMLQDAGFSATRRLELPFWGDNAPILVASK